MVITITITIMVKCKRNGNKVVAFRSKKGRKGEGGEKADNVFRTNNVKYIVNFKSSSSDTPLLL